MTDNTPKTHSLAIIIIFFYKRGIFVIFAYSDKILTKES